VYSFTSYSRFWLLVSLWTLPFLSFAQAADVQRLVKEGVALHDQNEFDAAAVKYQEALKLDPTNIAARTELALTYNSSGKYAEAVALCRELVKSPTGIDPTVYVTYGNSLDDLKRSKEAAEVYQQGIKRFPTSGMLHFNLGLTHYRMQQPQEAITDLQQAARLMPRHPSSPMYLGMFTLESGNRIPGMLELARFLVLEPQSKRALRQVGLLDQAMQQGVAKTGENNITVNVNSSVLKGAGKKKVHPDNFGPSDMLLSMMSAMDYDDKNKGKTSTARFAEKFGSLCQNLQELSGQRSTGFVWEYYVPYFVAMEKAGHVPAFAYLIHSSVPDQPHVQQWLEQHPDEVKAFQEWSGAYEWAN
jgi:Flp pilus assembly protein TadD